MAEIKRDPTFSVFLRVGVRAWKVHHVTCGYRHTCVLLNNGLVKCIGRNIEGQTGYSPAGQYGDDLPPVDLGTSHQELILLICLETSNDQCLPTFVGASSFRLSPLPPPTRAKSSFPTSPPRLGPLHSSLVAEETPPLGRGQEKVTTQKKRKSFKMSPKMVGHSQTQLMNRNRKKGRKCTILSGSVESRADRLSRT